MLRCTLSTLQIHAPLPTVSMATSPAYHGSLAHLHSTRGMVILEPDLPVEEQKPAMVSDDMAWTFSWHSRMQTISIILYRMGNWLSIQIHDFQNSFVKDEGTNNKNFSPQTVTADLRAGL